MWRQIIELLLKNVARTAYNHWSEKKLLFEGYLINIPSYLKTAKEKANVIIIQSETSYSSRKACFEVGDIIWPTIRHFIEFRSFSELLKILYHLTLMN